MPMRKAILVPPGEGRRYAMGPIVSVFKADGSETDRGYSISEWWLEPNTQGPGAHEHDEDDVFYVLAGVMSFLIDGSWIDAAAGAFVLIPGGQKHDFENRGSVRSGVLNFSVPGGFEENMPMIQDWFREHPPGWAGKDAG